MDERDWLAERFEGTRPHLRRVAYRMLGSRSEAEDAVQEAWLRLSRADASGVDNLAGWLTTVVARVCLDMLRARKSRREEVADAQMETQLQRGEDDAGPEGETLMADSIGVALLVVLEMLAPAERLAFVLHDMFDLPFEEIAAIVGCSPVAARQLASRARRRVQGVGADADAEVKGQRAIVDAFLAASRQGDLGALLAVLDPNVVLRADAVAVEASKHAKWAPNLAAEIQGAADVAQTFAGRAGAAHRALVDGAPGAAWAPGGRPRAVFAFTIVDEKIVEIELIGDPERIRRTDVVLLA